MPYKYLTPYFIVTPPLLKQKHFLSQASDLSDMLLYCHLVQYITTTQSRIFIIYNMLFTSLNLRQNKLITPEQINLGSKNPSTEGAI